MELTKRQIEYPVAVYQSAIDAMNNENRRRGLISGKEKLYIKNVLVTLVEDGANSRLGNMYVPRDLDQLSDDAKLAIEAANKAIRVANELIY